MASVVHTQPTASHQNDYSIEACLFAEVPIAQATTTFSLKITSGSGCGVRLILQACHGVLSSCLALQRIYHGSDCRSLQPGKLDVKVCKGDIHPVSSNSNRNNEDGSFSDLGPLAGFVSLTGSSFDGRSEQGSPMPSCDLLQIDMKATGSDSSSRATFRNDDSHTVFHELFLDCCQGRVSHLADPAALLRSV